MDVYLLPVTPAPPGGEPAFELYCEPAPDADPEPDPTGAAPRPSLFGRLVIRFKQALAEGEAEERRQENGEADAAPTGMGGRMSRFLKRKLAAAVAEQRLLWHLRHATAARLHHPSTVTSARALDIAMAEFKKDFSKHRLWCVIDTVLVVAQTPLAFVPGPNVLAYYLIFRSVGHYFSLRGASRGMDAGLWTAVPSAPLTDLQQILLLDEHAREPRIAATADALGLERLGSFMRRITLRPRP